MNRVCCGCSVSRADFGTATCCSATITCLRVARDTMSWRRSGSADQMPFSKMSGCSLFNIWGQIRRTALPVSTGATEPLK